MYKYYIGMRRISTFVIMKNFFEFCENQLNAGAVTLELRDAQKGEKRLVGGMIAS